MQKYSCHMSSHQNQTPEAQEQFLGCDGRANLRPYKNPPIAKGRP